MRKRGAIERDYDQEKDIMLSTEGVTAVGVKYCLEVLLDIRDLLQTKEE